MTSTFLPPTLNAPRGPRGVAASNCIKYKQKKKNQHDLNIRTDIP